MTNPIHRNQNINYLIPISPAIQMPTTHPHSVSLRMSQSAQGSLSLKSMWDGITKCFKSFFTWLLALFPCFLTTGHACQQPRDQIARIAARDGFIWFYKQEENPLTAFLGNFHPCTIKLWGLEFQCAEAAFQAAKFSPDRATMARFQHLDGEAAFRLGRDLSRYWTGPQIQQWRNRNVAVMREVLAAKFTQNAPLRDLLLATGNAYLVEHIPVKNRDAFWGDDYDGTGQNKLGILAMEARANLGGVGVVSRNPQYDQFLSRNPHYNRFPSR